MWVVRSVERWSGVKKLIYLHTTVAVSLAGSEVRKNHGLSVVFYTVAQMCSMTPFGILPPGDKLWLHSTCIQARGHASSSVPSPSLEGSRGERSEREHECTPVKPFKCLGTSTVGSSRAYT